jgi:hypothetical protein
MTPTIDPEQLVSLAESRSLGIGMRSARLYQWVKTNRLRPAGTRSRTHGAVVWLYRLGDLIALRKEEVGNWDVPIPEGYIDLKHAAEKLNFTTAHTGRLCHIGKLKGIKLPASPTRSSWFVLEADIERFLAANDRAHGSRAYSTPDTMTLREAADRLGLAVTTVAHFCHDGVLKAQYHGRGRHGKNTGRCWLIPISEVERLAAERAKPAETIGIPSIMPDIISADHRRCLQARRERFEAAGRRFVWNALDDQREAG